jgi:hypothetical protein
VSAAAEHEPAAESVAFLALAYSELAGRWSSVGPRLDGIEILDDLEQSDPELSLLTLVASDVLRPIDWQLVRWLGGADAVPHGEARGYAARDFELTDRIYEPWRLEAALHALAAKGEMERLKELGSLPAAFSLRIAERWREVENAIERWRGLGLATTREQIEGTYFDAVVAATGRLRDGVLDEHLEAPGA